MNGDADQSELARLNDKDVGLLYDICKSASLLDDPPFKAIFTAYNQVLVENGRERPYDTTILSALILVGYKTRNARPTIDPLTACKRLLFMHGLSIVDYDDDEQQHSEDALSITRDLTDLALGAHVAPHASDGAEERPLDKRRVSFDDANLEQTWLLESAGAVDTQYAGLLSQRPRRPKPHTARRRASISSLQPTRTPNDGHGVSAYIDDHSTHLGSFSDDRSAVQPSKNFVAPGSTLLLDPSQTNLVDDAESFAYMSGLRIARRCLASWHAATLLLQQKLAQASMTATVNDRRLILKDAFHSWRLEFASARERKREQVHNEDMERVAENLYGRRVLARIFTEWKESHVWQTNITAMARCDLLRMRYFRRWKAITDASLAKCRSILMRKVLAIWRSRVAGREVQFRQARAFREEAGLKSVYQAWHWQHLECKAGSWRTNKVLKQRFDGWRAAFSQRTDYRNVAHQHYASRVEALKLTVLLQGLRTTRQSSQCAKTHYQQNFTKRCLRLLHIRATLAPLTRVMMLRTQQKLQRKALIVLQSCCTSVRQAVEVDRLRMMHTAWTNWNDALRCQALIQKTDERILVENLYRWVLEERYRLFRRSKNQRLARDVMKAWSALLRQIQEPLKYANRVFTESQQRRQIAVAMLKLHSKVRQQEDSERAATEFANSKLPPLIFNPWSKQARHVHMLQQWANDARFYALTARALNLWHERMKQHKVERRRQAYTQIRAAIKVRLVRSCLNCMRERWLHLDALTTQARSRTQSGVARGGVAEIKVWRRVTDHVSDMNYTAASLDYQRLLGSSFAALFAHLETLGVLQSLAEEARRQADLDLLGRTLKRMQWVSFSAVQYAARRSESAEALLARTQGTHMRRIIRVWQAQSAASIAQRTQQIVARGRPADPESPSLRPANRAASRSTQHSEARPLTAQEVHMPTNLRTPSRSRNFGRFRPVLLTPAPVTPFDFDPANLVTVPDPPHTEGAQFGDNMEQTSTPSRSMSTSVAAGQEPLASQVTPFSRKLRAGGFSAARPSTTPAGVPSALRNSIFDPAMGGTMKSVRFSGAVAPSTRSRFLGRPELKQQDATE